MTTIPDESRAAIEELRSIGGDELVTEMLRTFLRFGDSQLQRLEEASAAADLLGAATIAHTMKSTARQLGALALGDACAAAELAGRGGDAGGLATATEVVRAAYAAARPWMQALASR